MPRIKTSDIEFDLPDNHNLMIALEKTGHVVEYQCRSGYCGTCRVKLISGSVSYIKPPLAFVLPDEILPCCCQVESDLEIICFSTCKNTLVNN